MTLRPATDKDASSNEFGTVEEQKRYLQDLKDGAYADAGFEPTWGSMIDMAEADDGVGVSSTKVRNAAKQQDWEVVEELCTEGVVEWIRDQGLYSEDASGKKMMS